VEERECVHGRARAGEKTISTSLPSVDQQTNLCGFFCLMQRCNLHFVNLTRFRPIKQAQTLYKNTRTRRTSYTFHSAPTHTTNHRCTPCTSTHFEAHMKPVQKNSTESSTVLYQHECSSLVCSEQMTTRHRRAAAKYTSHTPAPIMAEAQCTQHKHTAGLCKETTK